MHKILSTTLLTGALLMVASQAMAMSMGFESNLRVGVRGEAVVKLQEFLIAKEYLTIDSPTGFFGAATKKALINYQKDNNILATGSFGPITRNFIKNKMNMMNDKMGDAMKDNGAMDPGVMVGGAMMLPSRDIVDNAVLANNVTTVVAAVKAAGLVDTLKSKGPFTVFAPTNDAFAKLPTGTVEGLLAPAKKADLTSILTYHVVAGKYTSANLKDGMMLKTVNGKELKISVDAQGGIWINGTAKVLIKDILSSNGVTYTIDTVLLP